MHNMRNGTDCPKSAHSAWKLKLGEKPEGRDCLADTCHFFLSSATKHGRLPPFNACLLQSVLLDAVNTLKWRNAAVLFPLEEHGAATKGVKALEVTLPC